MARQRDISNEQILYALISSCKDDAQKSINKKIIVNEQKCKIAGYFSYVEKGTNNRFSGPIFLISETHDGKLFNIIYDERGNVLGSQSEEKGMKLKTAQDIEINEELLNQQLKSIEETDQSREQRKNVNTSDTTKGGEGRSLAEKEHEEKQETKEKEEGTQENTLPNLVNEISIDNNFRVRLDTVINGSYLWHILDLEEKLKTRMPDNQSEKIFRTGYLTAVDSAELTAKDGKPRKEPDTLVVISQDGKVAVELDETILEPKDLGSSLDKQRAEQDRIRYEDGKEAEKPVNNMNTRRTSLYQIPNVNSRYSVSENWYIGIDKSEVWANEARTPEDKNRKEISFVQASRNKSYHEREELLQGEDVVEYQLDTINEGQRTNKYEKEEMRQDRQLAAKDSSEAENETKRHYDGLIEKCYQTLPELKEYYNYKDIQNKIEKYHKTMNDEEVIEQIGQDLEYSKEVEHEQPNINRYN